MLYIDGIALSKLKDELHNSLSGRKLSKISQYDRFTLSLFFKKINLFFSINPSLPILFFSDSKAEANDVPLSFLLSLRKTILNSILEKVEQHGKDRILIFHFNKLTEIGEKKKYKLIFEVMGKHSNLLLIDENNKIIDLLKKFSLEENRLRVLLPGVRYQFPTIKEKLDPAQLDYSNLSTFKNFKEISEQFEGIGFLSAEEIFSKQISYHDFYEKFYSPSVYFENNIIKHASIFKYNSYKNYESKSFSSINEMLNFYIKETITSEQFNNLKQKILKKINSELNKNNKIIKLLKKDIQKNENCEQYKKFADILAANIYQIKMGMSKIELFDFYDNIDKLFELNPSISPNENINRLYKKYNKGKRALNFILERDGNIKKEINYLESIFISLRDSEKINDLKNIEKEMIDGGYLKNKIKKKKKVNESFSIKEIILENNDKILIGKNNKENEILTFSVAEKHDLWFHAKDIPGSHVILKASLPLNKTSIEEAASYAALYSKSKNENLVQVDYVEKKYIKKPKASKPGFVIYKNEKTLFIKPKAEKV